MKYLCLAYGAEADWVALTAGEQSALLAQDEVLRARGTLMAAVRPTATTVRAPGGAVEARDGAFAASAAPLAGFCILEAASLDEAIRLVANTPCPRAGGAIEIREITQMNDVGWVSAG